MKKYISILILAIILVFSFSNISYAYHNKTILILVDEMNFRDIENIFNDDNYGIGFINLKTRKPYVDESLYFSIMTGRKVGISPKDYKGLYKNRDGTIKIAGFQEMYKNLRKINNIQVDLLGEKLKKSGISYIGDKSSAVIAADKYGSIKTGEIEIKYENDWLVDRTKFHLSNSNTLVLSYDINNEEYRIELLGKYIDEFSNYNIIIFPRKVSKEMEHILNKRLVPIVYIKGQEKGLLTSSSTKREGFIAIEDIFFELLSVNGEKSPLSVGAKIKIIESQNSIVKSQNLFKKTINLLWAAYIFHGIVYFIQCYSAYYIQKKRKDKIETINLFNKFAIVNLAISLLMGASSLHINIVLYMFINILATYIITLFMSEKEVNTIGLFSTLTYGLIIFGIIFFPEILYNSYIGFNNLFYGARFYGFNNGIMGVLLATSVISYYFIEDLMPNKSIKNIVCILYFAMNMMVLSVNYGANTGGFLTSLALFIVMMYVNFLNKKLNIKNIILLLFIGIFIFTINMYFDNLSDEKSHAINFLIRIKAFGFNEFIDMFKIKFKELIKLTILPPFSIVILSQALSLKNLLKDENTNIRVETYIILFIAIIGFILNDTGMITFIYMNHYLISWLIYNSIETLSNV